MTRMPPGIKRVCCAKAQDTATATEGMPGYSRILVLLSCLAVVNSDSSVAAQLVDEFDGLELDTCVWNTFQSEYPRSFTFEEEQTGEIVRRYLVNTIDEAREDEDRKPAPCSEIPSLASESAIDEDELQEEPGPSLISPEVAPRDAVRSCDGVEPEAAEVIFQRSELRLRSRLHRHPVDEPYWYNLVLKVDGDIPECGSSRWVTAQWKYDDPEWPQNLGFSPSPFLAQRFDNGVLNVTIQNGQCRCMVASAEGDPDLASAQLFSTFSRPRFSDLQLITPLRCSWTGNRKGVCKPDETLQVFALSSPEPPPLPDPKKDWVSMMYRVKSGTRGEGEIDIYADSEFIVRVTGLIGYPWGNPGDVKFKFGHYRNKIPGRARLLVDRFCLSEDAAACDPELRVFDQDLSDQ